ncbi:diguanylate cyclase [Chungangia koreensis]|uniref:Diguanylate cyclase n=1 Tax=Chungangia koreensis TaxID=752657 RepID=A0ABV8X733_9LACT
MMTTRELKMLQREVTLLRADGKYKETINKGMDLLEIGKELKDPKSQLVALLNIAACYYSIGAIGEAFESIDNYQKICYKFGDSEDYLQLYNVLFLLYEYHKDYERAIETLEKSKDLALKLKKYNIASNAYSNLSHVFMEKGNFAGALKMANAGLEMAKFHEPESPLLEFRVKLNIAKALIGTKALDKSIEMIEQMVKEPVLEANPREMAQCYMLYGEWYAANGKTADSLHFFEKAKDIVEGYSDHYLLKSILEEMIRLSEVKRDYERGFYFQKEYISLLKDINEQELSKKALKLDLKYRLYETEKRANTDSLTGIFNREYIENKVDDWLKSGSSVVCIVFDIDDFKKINDNYGHLFGDEVIRNTAKACNSLIEKEELFGRYGGDEFVILMKESTLEKGREKAKYIQQTLEHLLEEKAGTALTLRTSFGVSSSRQGSAKTFKELFHLADQALYKAKMNGKNQIMYESQ